MLTILLLHLASLFLFQSQENKAADLAFTYIESIEQGIQTAENYWALNELYQSTCDKTPAIQRLISGSDSKDLKTYFTASSCVQTSRDSLRTEQKLNRIRQVSLDKGLVSLGTYFLINETDHQKKSIFINNFLTSWSKTLPENEISILTSIIEKKTIPVTSITGNNPELIFYSIIYGEESSLYFKNDDLNLLVNSWLKTIHIDYNENTVRTSLHTANLIYLLFEQNKYSALHNLLPFIESKTRFPVSNEYIRHNNALSYAFYVIGRYDESLKILREHLIPITQFLEDRTSENDFLYRKGVNLYSLGKFQEAKLIFEFLNDEENTTISKAELFNNLSICYLRLGEKNKYITYLLDALEESVEEENYIIELYILRNLFYHYTSIGDYDTALNYLTRAEELAISKNDNREIPAIYLSKGIFYWESLNDSDKALNLLSLATSIADINLNYFEYIRSLKIKAEIYLSVGSYQDAIDTFQQIREIAVSKTDNLKYVESLVYLAKIHFILGNNETASALIDEINVYPSNELGFELSVNYNTVKALNKFYLGSKRDAAEELKSVAYQILDRITSDIDSQTGFYSLETEYVYSFNTLISMLLEIDQKHEAIQLLDELKTLNDAALYNSPILRANRLTEEDLATDKLLNTEIQKLRTDYLNAAASQKLSIKAKIDRLSAQREEILNKVRAELPSSTVSVWGLQRQLADDEMIFHYTEVGDILYASLITSDDISIKSIEFDSEVKNLFSTAADHLASGSTNLDDLYKIQTILGVQKNIPPFITSLILIPDNFLYRIPLGALPITVPSSSTSYGTTRYVIEEFDIQYFTSLSEYLDNNRPMYDRYDSEFSAFAISDFSNFESIDLPSLPYARDEVQNIDEVLKSFKNKQILVQNDATKEAFIEHAKNSKIVHIATHSEVSEQDPLFSTIFLNSTGIELDRPGDALYAYELFEANMHSQLVMLNSCSSGSGNYIQGSGVMGISRALRYAGAKSLALNLWSVNDKIASEFATLFYREIEDGSTKPAAIRTAKLELLKTGNANPYYWGAYMLIGNPSPLTEKPASAGFLYPLLVAIIFSAMFTFRSRM